MTIIVWFVLGTLAFKLIWNLAVPFVLLKRFRANPESQTSRISMLTMVEIVLLILAIGLSALSTGQIWVNKPLIVAGLGIAAIAFTYVNLVIVGAVGGWLIRRAKSKNGTVHSKAGKPKAGRCRRRHGRRR